jgi:hypothetical protein
MQLLKSDRFTQFRRIAMLHPYTPCSFSREQRYAMMLSGRFSGSCATSRLLPILFGTVEHCLSDLPFFRGIGHIQRRDRHGFSPCSHFFIRPALGRTAKLTQVSKEHTTAYNRWCGQLQAKNRSLFKQQNTPVFSFLMTQSGCFTVFDSLIVSKNQTPSNTGIRP